MKTQRWIQPVVFTLVLIGFAVAPSASIASDTGSRKGAYSDHEIFALLPGTRKLFSQRDLDLIKEKLEDRQVDNRYHIDRTEPRYRQLNAIGQVVVDGHQIGTGTLVYTDLVYTANHVAERVGQSVVFNVGQSNNSTDIWADSASGLVIATGFTGGDNVPYSRDWALIRITQPLGKKYGFIEPWVVDDKDLKDAWNEAHGVIAGFPAFKDPRYLWGVIAPKEELGYHITASPGLSGGPYLWEYSPGKFRMTGMVKSEASTPDFVAGPGDAFSLAAVTLIDDFEYAIFAPAFGPAYRAAVKQSPKP